jgi:hypothetical protein
MARSPLESRATPLREPHPDLWRTISAWLWVTYLVALAAASLRWRV